MTLQPADAARPAASRYLIDALFDFEALPGRYPVVLREPRVLFDRSRDVLMLAAGRAVPGLMLESLETPRVQKAACFFIRTALLRPGADHYTLLGLEPGFHKDALRDHYRMLIRLTHPDFAATSGAWPSDAATRINQANDVLASVVSRADYDRSRASVVARGISVNSLAAVLPRPTERHRPARWGWALAGLGTVALALLTSMQWPENIDDAHPAQQATADAQVAEAAPVAPATASKPADEVVKVAKVVKDKKEAQGAKVAQAEKEARIAKEAKEAKAAKLANAEKEVQVVKLAQAAKEAQVVKLAQAAKDAQAAKVAQAAKEVQAAKVAQASRLAQEVPVAQPVVAVASFKPPVPALQSPQPQPQPASEPAARLSLVDAQPALNHLIQAMQAGRGEELLRGLDRSVRQSKGAADLVNAYNFLVGGSNAVRLGPVQLRGRPNADQFAVDGVVQLVLHDQGPPPPVRELRLRAVFAQRDGQVVMTELSTGGARP